MEYNHKYIVANLRHNDSEISTKTDYLSLIVCFVLGLIFGSVFTYLVIAGYDYVAR